MNAKQLQTLANIRAVLGSYNLPELEIVEVREDRVFFQKDYNAPLGMNYLVTCAGFKRIGHGDDVVLSYREPVPWYALQIVFHRSGLIECDFDIGNPRQGLAPALCHFIELCWPGKTDAFRVMRGLQKRGVPVKDVRDDL
jgi:hypothetical protein